MINQKELKELVNYDPETGIFTHIKARRKVKVGCIAGTPHSCGYWRICLLGKNYLAHRLAWLYMTGEFPKYQMDHINHDRNDNRFSNICEATNQTNHMNRPMQKNNKSGFVGVYFSNTYNKWVAELKLFGKKKYLGKYDCLEDAVTARKKGNIKYGFHENHGANEAII